MAKYIVIRADENDADYLTEKSLITDEQIELIKPVIEQLKVRRDKYNQATPQEKNDLRHNWETSEFGRQGDPTEMYVETGLLTQEQVNHFNDFVPHGEYGVHTIDSIEIVEEGITLF